MNSTCWLMGWSWSFWAMLRVVLMYQALLFSWWAFCKSDNASCVLPAPAGALTSTTAKGDSILGIQVANPEDNSRHRISSVSEMELKLCLTTQWFSKNSTIVSLEMSWLCGNRSQSKMILQSSSIRSASMTLAESIPIPYPSSFPVGKTRNERIVRFFARAAKRFLVIPPCLFNCLTISFWPPAP